jgi:glucan biosynthesis protein
MKPTKHKARLRTDGGWKSESDESSDLSVAVGDGERVVLPLASKNEGQFEHFCTGDRRVGVDSI